MLAREINVFESQEVVSSKIEQLVKEIEELQAKSTSEEIILKQKQLHALVTMIQELKGEQLFNQAKTQLST